MTEFNIAGKAKDSNLGQVDSPGNRSSGKDVANAETSDKQMEEITSFELIQFNLPTHQYPYFDGMMWQVQPKAKNDENSTTTNLPDLTKIRQLHFEFHCIWILDTKKQSRV